MLKAPLERNSGSGSIQPKGFGVYQIVLLLFGIIVCGYNLLNGFGEDQDSVRILEAAHNSHIAHKMIASRSWGFPLYESPAYFLINAFHPSLLPAKLLSLFAILGAVLLLFDLLLNAGVSQPMAFLLCLIFLGNPLIIIAGNTIMETAMNVFFLVLAMHFFFKKIAGRKMNYTLYVTYAVYFGLANLVRPDNMFFFPSLFIYLFFRREFNWVGIIISVVCFFVVGILPYYAVGYPIFKELPMALSYYFIAGIKNIVATFGLPLFGLLVLLLVMQLTKRGKQFLKVFSWKDDGFCYVTILLLMVIFRILAVPLELEYGIFIWVLFIILLGLIVRQLLQTYSQRILSRILVVLAIANFMPNLIQLSFFKEVNFDYKFSPGISMGVFEQEKQVRILNDEIFHNSEKVLREASASVARLETKYRKELHYTECDTCIVLTTERDIKLYRAKGTLKLTNPSHSRIVLAPDFNVSRGWRNFIKADPVPHFTSDRLKVR